MDSVGGHSQRKTWPSPDGSGRGSDPHRVGRTPLGFLCARQGHEGELMNTVNELLARLESARFYGSLEIKLEAGRVVLIRKTESIRPQAQDTNYRINRGETYERSK